MSRRWARMTVVAMILMGCSPAGAVTRVGEVAIDDTRFTPPRVTIEAGGEVVWVHRARDRHTVTADDGSFDSGVLGRRTQFQRTFHTAGQYRYHCRFHGEPGGDGMSGVVVVRPAFDAPFRGSMSGSGYLTVGEDGGIFNGERDRDRPRPGGVIMSSERLKNPEATTETRYWAGRSPVSA